MRSNLLSLFVLFWVVLMIPFKVVSQTTCPIPTNPATTNISTNSATLSWNASPGAVAYVVQYHAPGAAWINMTTQTNSITLTNLACGVTYEWHVATYCNNNTSTPGPYSTGAGFTTAPCTTTCPAPTGLTRTNITATGATLVWNAVAGAPGYVVQYHAITNPASPWITVNGQTGSSATLTNLTCGTRYEWHVQTYCGNGALSPYSASADFSTAACTTPNCYPPAGLTTTNISTTGATLSWSASPGAVAYVVQYHAPGAAWINMTTQTNSITLTNLACGVTYEWHVATYCNNNTSTPGPYSTGAGFTTAPCTTTCPAPTGLTRTNITATGATLVWNALAGAPGYVVQYHAITTPASPWITVNGQTGSSATLTNLTCGTRYEWHVQTYCGNGALSPYSASADFTTAACITPCYPPAGLTTTNISTTGATLSWNASPGAVAYIVQYHAPGGTWINMTTQTNSITLTNLACGVTYEWHVATYCNNNTSTPGPYSTGAGFTTAPCTTTCLAPTGLTRTNLTATGATLVWNAPAGAAGYVVQYHAITTPASPWITVTGQTGSSATLTNLTCGTRYEWHVQTYCGNGVLSPYSASADFSTAACTTANCYPPAGLTTTNISTTGATLSWNASPGAVAYVVQYHAPGAAWINMTTQTNSITLNNLACGVVYEWHVATYCNNNTSTPGPYSTGAGFTTAPCTTTCPAPTGLSRTNITATGATLVWNAVAGAPGYIVQYRVPGAAWINVTTQTNSITLANLVCGTHIEWHVASYCGSSATNISPYSNAADFTTLPCATNICPAPSGLISFETSAGSGSRMLTWNAIPGAVGYNIRYRVRNTATWTTTTSNTSSKMITGLQHLSPYEWQVQSICSTATGAVSESTWCQPAFFETTQVRAGIYPNPVSGSRIQVPVVVAVNATVSFIISDQTGRIVSVTDRTIAAGSTVVNIDIATLREGIYFLEIRGGGRHEVQRLVITR